MGWMMSMKKGLDHQRQERIDLYCPLSPLNIVCVSPAFPIRFTTEIKKALPNAFQCSASIIFAYANRTKPSLESNLSILLLRSGPDF